MVVSFLDSFPSFLIYQSDWGVLPVTAPKSPTFSMAFLSMVTPHLLLRSEKAAAGRLSGRGNQATQ